MSIQDPKQLNETGDSFGTYLRQQGIETLFNANSLDPTRREKLQLFCSETTLLSSNLATGELDNDFFRNIRQDMLIVEYSIQKYH